jgi:hypothetical protein
MKKYLLSASIVFGLSGPGMQDALAQANPMAAVTDDPQTAKFTATSSLTFPGESSLELSDVSTIELWVKPGWTSLKYDPVLLSATSDGTPRYAIVMTADKQSIGLYSRDDWDYTEFDFADGKAHHVAFVNQGDLTDVYIDGELHDTITQPIADIPVRTFHIGSVNGTLNPFVGELSEIRLWDTALEEDDIVSFQRVHILSKTGLTHPDLDSLVGVSDFANKARGFTLMNNVSAQAELLEDLALAQAVAVALPPQAPVVDADGTVIEPLTAEELALFDDPVEAAQPAASAAATEGAPQ